MTTNGMNHLLSRGHGKFDAIIQSPFHLFAQVAIALESHDFSCEPGGELAGVEPLDWPDSRFALHASHPCGSDDGLQANLDLADALRSLQTAPLSMYESMINIHMITLATCTPGQHIGKHD